MKVNGLELKIYGSLTRNKRAAILAPLIAAPVADNFEH